MANIDRVNGLMPVQHINGAPWNGQTMKMYKATGTTVTDDLFPGDPVVMDGDADADGIPRITKATLASTNNTCGVIVSIDPKPTNLERTWLDGADSGYVNVCTDMSAIYEIQVDAAIAAGDIGANSIAVQTSNGSRTGGTSGIELSQSDISTTNTDMFLIIGLAQRVDNEFGVNNKVLVLINDHQFANQISGV